MITLFVISFSMVVVEVCRKFNAELIVEIVACGLVTAFEEILSAEHLQRSSNSQLLSFQEVLSIGLSRLIQSKLSRQFLSPECYWKWVFSWIRLTHLSHFDSVICQEVMDDKGSCLKRGKEFQNLSVIL